MYGVQDVRLFQQGLHAVPYQRCLIDGGGGERRVYFSLPRKLASIWRGAVDPAEMTTGNGFKYHCPHHGAASQLGTAPTVVQQFI